MRATRTHQDGFTLVELLISLGILGLLLTAVVSVNIGTSRSAAGLQARNDLQPELQLTQNYMASKLAQASYVFPSGSSIQLTSSGSTTTNYAGGPTGTYTWVVGTDPIIAFIVPPKTVTVGGCAAATASTASDYCYAFYAFYAMNRANYLVAVSGADDPGANAANDSTASVLLEYRGYYSAYAPVPILSGFGMPTPAQIPTGSTGRLLMDFLAPSTATFPLFSTNAPLAAASQIAGTTTVTMNLAALQNVSQQVIRVPAGTTTTYGTLTVYPRNVGKAQLIN